MAIPTNIQGKVILAAAGPGDPDLITVKATRWLQQADVVLTDRLVSNDILTSYVNPSAEIIYVGKQCRKGNSTPQETINALMCTHALAGKLVVRLKGGDVSVFSNILDELQVLKESNIAYEIVPGVTSALGAAAYAGMPLTARGYSTAVRLMTYYKSDIVPDDYWKELASTKDTLVFYMSAETVEGIVTKLIRNGVSNDTFIAVIEQATTPLQQVHAVNIYDFEKIQDIHFLSPSLVVVGRVAALHHEFAWLTNSEERKHYFKPVATIQNNSNNNKKAHVSRA
ncbi:MAG: uroporphyrinogen-III C-methyltransferase [Terrimonas sp.]|nr:uroporphyrinogen-III C-methyltransferase [Terrimonas sp.]OJY93368.1 MAG: uroporphyrinogen-III C-methyltransferase [Sphingobacteriales bacterium 40-81]